MDTISLADAETRLSELIDRVEAGEDIDITRDGKAVARLSAAPRQQRTLKPVDVDALKRLTDSMPMANQSAGDLVRAMRDDERY